MTVSTVLCGAKLDIYLDNLASTPIDPRVLALQNRLAETFHANPNSVEHLAGCQARTALETAANDVACFLGNADLPIIFSPSASSALWLALQDVLIRANGRTVSVFASEIEHPALLHQLAQADRVGQIELTRFPVDKTGQPDLATLELMTLGCPSLICMMAANNELGIFHPIEAVLGIAAACGARTLIDASQAAGRINLHGMTRHADYLVISGAKMYGPRRSGVLAGALHSRTSEIAETIFGTPDAAAASAMAYACQLRDKEMDADEARIALMRDRLEAILTTEIPRLVVNGDRTARFSGALHISNPDVPGDVVVSQLFGKVAVSTGAACQSGVPGTSHVLTAIKLADELADGAIRICVGKFNTEAEIENAGSAMLTAMRPKAAIRGRA